MADAPADDAEHAAEAAGEHRWPVSRSGRVAGVVLAAVFMLLGSALAFDGGASSDPAAGVVLLVVAPVVAWLCAWRPYVLLTAGEVVVQNPLRKHRIPLAAVESADSGRYGLFLHARGRRPVRVWAVQKSDISNLFARTTRADAVVRTILEAAHGSPPPS